MLFSTFYKNQKKLSINKWMDKEEMQIFTMQSDSGMKKNVMTSISGTYLKLEIILSEVQQDSEREKS